MIEQSNFSNEVIYNMFKVILKQPWAEMASAGLMIVAHNDAPPEEMPKRIFFLAMEPDYSIRYPIEWLQEVHNHQVFGNIACDDLPINAVVGFADVGGLAPEDFNIWSRGAPPNRYFLVNACKFDNPIPIEQVADLNAERMPPYHKVCRRFLYESENDLVIPVSEEVLSSASQGKSFEIDLIGNTANVIIDRRNQLKPFSAFRLICGNKEKRFLFTDDCRIVVDVNEDGSLKYYPSVLRENGVAARTSLQLCCDHPIGDY